MASQSVQPAQSVAAATPAPASAASSAGAAGAGAGAGSGAGASSSSSSSSFQPNAAQRNQLAELRSLQALSSFERSNSAYCNQVYNTHCRMIESTIVQVMNDPSIELAEKDPTIKIAPMAWRFDVFPALNKGGNQYTYAYETDIPGTTYMMTPQPSFYLPKELKLGRNCREVRQKKKNAAIALKNSMPDPAKMSFAESAAAAAAPPPTVGGLGSFAEWVVDKLCDNELQHTVEASGVLNSWDEGSYLSVVKTDGDGNCLAHAVMTAVYGMSDSKGSLRDATFWEMSSAARKNKYLERYMYEQARLAATPGAIASQAAVDKYLADKDNVAALTKEFERCTERLSNAKNYCEPIHVFVMAHVMRRPIIVYGSKHFGAKGAEASTMAPQEEEEEKKGGESGMVDAASASASSSSSAAAAASSAASSSPLNSMVGLYIPVEWHSQHKLDQQASADNPQLKPICLLYSCADEATGQGGHFSALTTTDDMLPCHGLVPLQQWDGYNSSSKSCNNLASAACATPGMDLGEPALPLLPLRFLLPHINKLEGNVVHVLNKHMEITQTATGHWYAKMQLNKCMEYLKHGWQYYLQLAQTLWVTIDSGMPVLDNASPDSAMAAALAESKGEGGLGGVADPLGGLGDMSMEYARLLQAQEMQGFSDADDLSVSPDYDDDADDLEHDAPFEPRIPETDVQFWHTAITNPRDMRLDVTRWKQPVQYAGPAPHYLERRPELLAQMATPNWTPTFAQLAQTIAQLLSRLDAVTTTRIDHARVLQACVHWANYQHERWSAVKTKTNTSATIANGSLWHRQAWYAALFNLPPSSVLEVPVLSLPQVLSLAHSFNISLDHLECATMAATQYPNNGLPQIDLLPGLPEWDGASDAAKQLIDKLKAQYNKQVHTLMQLAHSISQPDVQQQLAQQRQRQQQHQQRASLLQAQPTVDDLHRMLEKPDLDPPTRAAIQQYLDKLMGMVQQQMHPHQQPQQQATSPVAPQPVRAGGVGTRVAQAIAINPQSVARAAAVAQATAQSPQQSGVVQAVPVVASAVPGSSAFRASAVLPSASGSVAPTAGVSTPPAVGVPARPAHSRSNSEDVDEEAQLQQALRMSMQAEAEAEQGGGGGGGGSGGSEDGEVIEHADAVAIMQKEA